MSNKTKDILDEVLDIEEPTTELVEKKSDTLTIKRDDNLEDVDVIIPHQTSKMGHLLFRNLFSVIICFLKYYLAASS